MQDGGQPTPEIMTSILAVRKDSVTREARRRKSSVTTVTEEMEEDSKPGEPREMGAKEMEAREDKSSWRTQFQPAEVGK